MQARGSNPARRVVAERGQMPRWDDLAATPEEVPVHDWQKQELERRKANLLKNRESASTWQDVLRRVRGGNGR